MTAPLVGAWLGEGARRVTSHDVVVSESPQVAYRAILELPLADLPVTRALFRIRGIAYDRGMTVKQLFTSPPFRLLEETVSSEIVFEIARSGFRAVGNIRVEPLRLGARISTATWVETWGWLATASFRAYWLVVAPFSRWIRREMLRAAKRRAERRASA